MIDFDLHTFYQQYNKFTELIENYFKSNPTEEFLSWRFFDEYNIIIEYLYFDDEGHHFIDTYNIHISELIKFSKTRNDNTI